MSARVLPLPLAGEGWGEGGRINEVMTVRWQCVSCPSDPPGKQHSANLQRSVDAVTATT
ncbi:hypothetical protein CBM2587_A120120 [Cupriavidus taiwanensis]|uniref:Uncharacterized protein n=1 Tax=Cupriavidus taiwanensis TaxID=164546 RepID=A0A975WUQ5_9BURK|nr:hypothetical protein CBM2587_A120120 [Cupriavidus taiwanensis]